MQIYRQKGVVNLSIRSAPPLGTRPSRSSGIHASSIIRHRAVESGALKKDAVMFGRNMYDPIDEKDMPIAVALGCAWEDYLAPQYPDIQRPPEIEKDGIYMSPDGIYVGRHPLSWEEDTLVLVEFKLTWKSMNKPIQEQSMYLQQCMSYCHALSTPYCQLHVLYVNGNYQFGDSVEGGPQYVVFSIKFTRDELEENWNSMLYHSQFALPE